MDTVTWFISKLLGQLQDENMLDEMFYCYTGNVFPKIEFSQIDNVPFFLTLQCRYMLYPVLLSVAIENRSNIFTLCPTITCITTKCNLCNF